jgi:hypothetical protein
MKSSIFAHTTAVAFAASCLVVATTARADLLLGVHFDSGDLYSISENDASVTLIGDTGVPGLGSLEFAPDGTLYGFTLGANATLYSIDPATAAATEIGPLNLGFFVYEGGLAFAPDGTAYATNGINQSNPLLFRLDLDTGNGTPIGLMTDGDHDVGGLAWREDGKGGGTLIGLDRILPSSLLLIDPGNAITSTLSELNPGITAGINGGMALLSLGGQRGDGEIVGYFSTAGLSGDGPGDNSLYWFDPVNGNHGLIGAFNPDVITGSGFGGLAIVPEPASLVLLALGGLTLLHRRRK